MALQVLDVIDTKQRLEIATEQSIRTRASASQSVPDLQDLDTPLSKRLLHPKLASINSLMMRTLGNQALSSLMGPFRKGSMQPKETTLSAQSGTSSSHHLGSALHLCGASLRHQRQSVLCIDDKRARVSCLLPTVKCSIVELVMTLSLSPNA